MNVSKFIAVALAWTVLGSLLHPKGTLGQEREQLTIAVVDFTNTGDDRELQPLVQGIPESITTYLAKKGKVRIVERSRLEAALNELQLALTGIVDEQTAVEVGKAVGATGVLVGSFLKMGDRIRINARLIDVKTGEVIAAEQVQGQLGTQLFDLMDQTAEAMWAKLVGRPIEIQPIPVSRPPTIDLRPYQRLVGKKVIIHPKDGTEIRGTLLSVSDREITYTTPFGFQQKLPLGKIATILEQEQKPYPQEAQRILRKGEKSVAVGCLSAWLLPSLGHAYAGDWGRGVKFLLGEGVGVALILAGLSDTEEVWDDWGYEYEEEITDEGQRLVNLGALIFVGFRLWEYIDVYDTIKDHNQEVKRALEQAGLELKLRDAALMAQLTYNF